MPASLQVFQFTSILMKHNLEACELKVSWRRPWRMEHKGYFSPGRSACAVPLQRLCGHGAPTNVAGLAMLTLVPRPYSSSLEAVSCLRKNFICVGNVLQHKTPHVDVRARSWSTLRGGCRWIWKSLRPRTRASSDELDGLVFQVGVAHRGNDWDKENF